MPHCELLVTRRGPRQRVSAGARARGAQRTLLALGMLMVVGCQRHRGAPPAARWVSLSPAVTETLFALGATRELVGVSDYCHYPPAAQQLPKLGTILTPRYEALAQARPSLILAEASQGARHEMERIAPVQWLAWLTPAQVASSTRLLGLKVGHAQEAEQLARKYEALLTVPVAPNAPRVLIALAHAPGNLTEVWYIRPGSLHGAALHAAGFRNAVATEPVGAPRLGLESAIALDPDWVVVLTVKAEPAPLLERDWRALTGMKAVREAHLRVLTAPELEVPGPRIFTLVERLRRELSPGAEEPRP